MLVKWFTEVYTYITNVFRNIFRKIKEIMASKKVQRVLAIGSVAATAFLVGKYYERFYAKEFKLPSGLKPLPALPYFGTESVNPNKLDSNINTSIINTTSYCIIDNVEPIKDNKIFKLFKNLGTVAASTPVQPSDGQLQPKISSEIMKCGYPGFDNLKVYDNYVVSYDRRNRVAHWVFEHITADTIKKNDQVDRSKCDFKPDETIHPYFRSLNEDYKRSGYDRGHLAAAGNHKSSQKYIENTFYLSNIAPQVGKGFNRDAWNNLEKYVRKLARKYLNIYVCTGPLYLPEKASDGKIYIKYEVIGANHVAVPTHFFKIVVAENSDGKFDMHSFVMPNQAIDSNLSLDDFHVDPYLIEKASGLLFFDKVNRKKLNSINPRTRLPKINRSHK